MKYLISIGHPAQFHLFKNIISELHNNNHETKVLITTKDILEYLCVHSDFDFENLFPKRKNDSKFSLVINCLKRYQIISKVIKKFKPDILLGSEVTLPILGKRFGIPSIVFSEDDAKIIPQFARMAYPFTKTILCPEVCSVGKWGKKKISYNGYHELAYLNPKYFFPDKSKIKEHINIENQFFILRFSDLSAYHDRGKKGIIASLGHKLIKMLETKGNIYITSERELEAEFEPYRIKVDPINIHHALYYATMYIGDSQTMAAEATVLGTPSLRFNDFVGKLGYLEELEHKYGLTYGIKTSEPDRLLSKIEMLLSMPNLNNEWQKRRKKMLSEKIDVSPFVVWFVENYPQSVQVMKENPDYQYNFKITLI